MFKIQMIETSPRPSISPAAGLNGHDWNPGIRPFARPGFASVLKPLLTKRRGVEKMFRNFEIGSFEFVSDFGFRVSDLNPAMSESAIYLLPLGPVPEEILLCLRTAVEPVFGMPTRLLPSRDLPLSCYDPHRNQYFSTGLLKKMLRQLPRDTLKVLGITPVDLFIPIMKYIFGEAQVSGKGAIISLFRLRPETYGAESGSGFVLGADRQGGDSRTGTHLRPDPLPGPALRHEFLLSDRGNGL